MFSQAELNQAVIKGRYEDPSAIQLVNAVKNNNQRIRNYLESIQTSVGSGHLVLKILAAMPVNPRTKKSNGLVVESCQISATLYA